MEGGRNMHKVIERTDTGKHRDIHTDTHREWKYTNLQEKANREGTGVIRLKV